MNTISFSQNTPIVHQNSVTFQRKLHENEKAEYEKTMNDAFNYLGIKNRALIIHGSSFPSDAPLRGNFANLGNKNPYIGTPYCAKEFTDFVKMNGFNAIQLGPGGKLNKRDNSPYHSSVFAKNELFLDYERLKSDEYAAIISDKDFRDIRVMGFSTGGNHTMADFDEAQLISKAVTHTAYSNFKSKLNSGDKAAEKLNTEYLKFKKDNNYWLEKDSMFRLFSDIHGTDNFKEWDNELDKNLITRIEQGDDTAKARYRQIKTQPGAKEALDEYKFIQFLVDKEEREDKTAREDGGIKYIGDLLVGYSYADEWSNPDAFLSDWRVGCPDGGKNNGPQLWDIAVLNPRTLFNSNGSLGASGKLLKQKIERALSGVENIRIDNVMGMVDPYVYKSSAVRKDGSIDHTNGNFLSQTGLDPQHNYPKILHKILLPSLKEHNIDFGDVVFEDLGSQSQTFKEVFYDGRVDGRIYKDEKLRGIMYSKGTKMENVHGPRYSFLSTHDNEPTAELLKPGSWIYGNEGWNPMYLAGYLIPPYDEENAKKSAAFCIDIEKNPKTRLKAKYAELFRGTPNIQVSFADFFGIDKTYNTGGQENKNNWKLRLNPDYETTYHKSLETEAEPVMNMPELLGIAINSKAGISIAKHEKTKEEANFEIEDLSKRLAHWTSVLKEPENL